MAALRSMVAGGAQQCDEAGLMRELRLFRRRIMVRIAWAQTLALVTEESILQQLSLIWRRR
ncbi:hypothetical protein ACLBR5_07265 [Escherichia coli]